MDKKVYQAVHERSKGLCEICGSNGGGMVELHHIVGRRVKESPENCIMLCYEHHRGTWGVHGKNGSTLNINLKRTVQGYYKAQGLDEDTIREKMGGRLY